MNRRFLPIFIVFALLIQSVLAQAQMGGDNGMKLVNMPPATPEEAIPVIESRKLPENLNGGTTVRGGFLSRLMRSSAASPSSPASIAELARALKNDPDLIYEYVHNNIAYYPIFGVQKGALGTLLDHAGTDFDQAALMVALLRQAGFTAHFVRGQIELNAAQVQDWLGISTSSRIAAATVFSQGGIPHKSFSNPDGSLNRIQITHVWVKVNIGGTDYVFDPSFKSHIVKSGINVATAMGYDQASFLSGNANSALTGATVTADYVQNLNRAGIRSNLRNYTNTLVNYIKTNNPDATVDDILGGRTIKPYVGAPLRQTVLPYRFVDSANPEVEWTDIPNTYKPTLRVQYQGIDQTFTSDYLYGKRLTITYNASNQPLLSVDGAAVGSPGTAVMPGAVSQLTVTIVHNGYSCTGAICTGADQTVVNNLRGGGVYTVINGWGPAGRGLMEYNRERVAAAKESGLGDSTEPVLGENLAMLGNTWLAENVYSLDLSDRIASTTSNFHHIVGIAGRNAAPQNAPYVDLSSMVSVVSQTLDTTRRESVRYEFLSHSSIFESTVIEQNLSTDAVSTVRLLDLASLQGYKIYDATQSNYASVVRPVISQPVAGGGYSAGTLGIIDNEINTLNARVFLPENGQLTSGNWRGAGFFTKRPDGSILAFISGGLAGGYSTTALSDATVSTRLQRNQLASNTQNVFQAITEWSKEPIDLFTGNYTYSHDDLVIGNGAFPYTLSFQKHYNSGKRRLNGALGKGWTHNFAIRTDVGSDGFQGMGEDSAIDGAASIIEKFIALDLLYTPTQQLDRSVIVALSNRWLAEQLVNNTVTVTKGNLSEMFVKRELPDGTVAYNPPPNSATTLTRDTDGTFTYETPDKIALNFNSTGDIANWVHPAGPEVNFTYTGGKLTSVANTTGRSLTIGYDSGTGYINQVSDNSGVAGRTVTYSYDADGNLLRFTDTLGNKTTFAYDVPGRMTQIFFPSRQPDPNNPTVPFVTNSYDSLGRVATQTDGNGQPWNYYFAGARSEEVNPLGGRHILYFNPYGSAIREIDESGKETKKEYDGMNRLIRLIKPECNASTFEYNAFNNVTLARRLSKKTISGEANPIYNCTAAVPSALLPTETVTTYNNTWQKPATITDALGRVTTFSYDAANGNLLSITSPDPDGGGPQTPSVTRFTYNSRGQVLTVTDPLNTVTQNTYSPTTEVMTQVVEDAGTGKLNLTTTFTYNGVGNQTSIDGPRTDVNDTTTMVYDTQRRMTRMTLPDPDGTGSQVAPDTQFVYDADDNLVRSKALKTGTTYLETVMTYSDTFQKRTVTNPSNNTTTYDYDELGRLKTVTDAEGRKVRTTYDVVGRVNTVTYGFGASDGSTRALTYLYYGNGTRGRITDARGNQTNFIYDGFDRLSQTQYADGSYDGFSYDAADNMGSRRIRSVTGTPGNTVLYAYDHLNRMTVKTPQDQASTTYAYDKTGRHTRASFTGTLGAGDAYVGDWTFVYDAVGRLLSESRNDGSVKTVTYNYADKANRTRILYPGGFDVLYGHDATNSVVIIKENGTAGYLAGYSYDPLLRRVLMNYGNGGVANYAWEDDGDLDVLSHGLSPTESLTFNYGYDKTHRRNSLVVSVDAYSWHPGGTAGSTTTANYGTANSVNQYQNVGAPYTYDQQGNLTGNGVWTYTYDTENRLVRAEASPTVAAFTYDPLGRRYSKTVNGVKTIYLYAGGREIAEYAGNGTTLQKQFVWGTGNDELVAVRSFSGGTLSGIQYTHHDSLGSVIALVDASRIVNGRYAYGPFGESASLTGTSFGYTGQRYDAETGLYHYKARAYNPRIGRFLQTDPIAEGLNLYAYVNNDPLNATDPSGMAADYVVGKADEAWDITADWIARNPDIVALGVGAGIDFAAGGPTGEGALIATLIRDRVGKIARNKAVVSEVVDINAKTFYRSMTKAEAEAVKETGFLRGGREGETFFTDSRFRSATKVQDRLSLPQQPEVQMEFQIRNEPSFTIAGARVAPAFGGRGGGREYMTTDPVKVEIINVQPY
ncbi:hypothetical protein SD80_012640 [Scytonema tolypothrichoides VB-61278]|nr:hypothetical protein SD80_012640 [Scytonema tolypothrichoides VB-61278]